ncbi:ABC transporter permease [Spiribacter sp. C176]|uniref:ABC transporter permease n=1 Tax=Spiribacter salilacus TaxID=2664894 RepID=A0A6N7QS25_9GAMM|nr:ABC transporter permease [Spiribacter salilacus]MRH77127.1 ABC transporter permease [Spiribacter salilacus]
MDSGLIQEVVSATLLAGTPLIIAALGLLMNERAGVLNLGAEGMMSLGAVYGFIAALSFSSPVLGLAAGLMAGALVAGGFALLTITLQANQVASGLALAIFGVGLAGFVGKPYESQSLKAVGEWSIPLLVDIPWLGPIFFQQQPMVYLSWVLFGAVWWFLYRSRSGLLLRAVGEDPAAAHAIGRSVVGVRYLAVIFGGALCGLGGACLSIFYAPMWVEGLIAGRGWIALALVVFATWRPFRVLLGAYLFGGVLIAQLFLQGSGVKISVPSQLLSSLPYLATIIVLVLISRDSRRIRQHSPASLGRAFRADE